MSLEQADLGSLYEISLSISAAGSLAVIAERAASAYVDHLDCAAGGVFERVESPGGGWFYDTIAAVPDGTDTMQAAVDRVCAGADDGIPSAPGHTVVADSHYHVLALPSFGVLALERPAQPLAPETVEELGRLNENLAAACRGKQAESKLRTERNRFEAVFETIQEPLLNVVYRDGEPIIKRVNRAFTETFGYDRTEAIGQSVNDLIVPDDDELQADAEELDEEAKDGKNMQQEVRRETPDGIGDFLLRGAPVETTDQPEHFAMYVDITAEKERQRNLQQLYDETEGIMSASDREEICRQTAAAATDILGPSLVGTYLYDRTKDGLVPAATTSGVDSTFGDGPPTYTDEGTVVWEVYDSGEPVFIPEIATFDGQLPGEKTPASSAMILSLGSHGVFILSSTTPGAFDETDFSLARLLSKLVETALNRAQRIEGLEGVQDITREALGATEHEQVAETVLDEIPELFDLPISGIWEYDDGKEALVPVGSTEMAEELFGEIPTFDPGESVAWNAYETGELQEISDIGAHPEAYNDDSVLGSEICVPIGEFGVLATGSTTEENFTPSERRLLETLGANLETPVRLISRRQELELLDQVLARILRHNIRNDLTIIMGLAETIKGTTDGDPVEAAQTIIERCKSLQATAEHAAEIRHIVLNREQHDRLPLRELVQDAVSTTRSAYPDAHVETRFEAAPHVVVHPDFPVAVQHLVENAIEHNTADHPEVVVSVSNDESGVVLTVSDNGPGIPAHETEVLDQHGESALEHGSGAGLWIVDRVVDYSDGSVTFDSDENGTTVRIHLDT